MIQSVFARKHMYTLRVFFVAAIVLFNVNTASADWMVQVIGLGGRVDEQFGPFAQYEEARRFSTQWYANNRNDLRLTKEVELPSVRRFITPIDAILSRGTQQVESLLQTTRDIAATSGNDVPDAGQVMGEYKESVENAYASAKALKDEAVKSTTEDATELFSKMDKIIGDISSKAGDVFLQGKMSEMLEKSSEVAPIQDSNDADLASEIKKLRPDPIQSDLDAIRSKIEEQIESGKLSEQALRRGNAIQRRIFAGGAAKQLAKQSKNFDLLSESQRSVMSEIENMDLTRYVGRFFANFGYDGYRYIELNKDGTGVLLMAGQGLSNSGALFRWNRSKSGWINVVSLVAIPEEQDRLRDRYLRQGIEANGGQDKILERSADDSFYEISKLFLFQGKIYFAELDRSYYKSSKLIKYDFYVASFDYTGPKPNTWNEAKQEFDKSLLPKGQGSFRSREPISLPYDSEGKDKSRND